MEKENGYPHLPPPEKVLDTIYSPENYNPIFFRNNILIKALYLRINETNPGYFSRPTGEIFAAMVLGQVKEIADHVGMIPTLQGSKAEYFAHPDIYPPTSDWDIQLIPPPNQPPKKLHLSDFANHPYWKPYEITERGSKYRDSTFLQIPYTVYYDSHGPAEAKKPRCPLILTLNHQVVHSPTDDPEIYSLSLKILRCSGNFPQVQSPVIEFGLPLVDNSGQIVPIPAIDSNQHHWGIFINDGLLLINRDQLNLIPPNWLTDQHLLQAIMWFRNWRKPNTKPFRLALPPLHEFLTPNEHYSWIAHLVQGAIFPLDGKSLNGNPDILLSLLNTPLTRERYLAPVIPGIVHVINQLPDSIHPIPNWEIFINQASSRPSAMRTQLAFVDHVVRHLIPFTDQFDDPQVVRDEINLNTELCLADPYFHILASSSPSAAIDYLATPHSRYHLI